MNKQIVLSEAFLLPYAALILTRIFSSKIPFLSAVDIPVTAGLTYCFYLRFGGISPELSDALKFFTNKKYLLGCVILLLISLCVSAIGAVSFFSYLLLSGSFFSLFASFAAAAITIVLSVIQRLYSCAPEKGVKNAFFSFPGFLKMLPFGSICCLMIFVILSINSSRFPAAVRPLLTDIPLSAFIAYISRKYFDE